MLVLSRHTDERVMIGDDVIVQVVEIRGDKVRLGITAPGNVSVHREEVWLEIQQQVAIEVEKARKEIREKQRQKEADKNNDERG